MQIKINEQHYQKALELVQARLELLNKPIVMAHERADIDYRLKIHLQYLAPAWPELPKAAKNTAEAFLLISLCRIYETQHESQQMRILVSTWLQDQGLAAGVIAALQFNPPKDYAEFLVNLYYVQPKMRITLIQLWQSLGHSVPNQLLEKALVSDDLALVAAALEHAAYHRSLSLSQFQKIIKQADEPQIAIAALWGLWFHGANDFTKHVEKMAQKKLQHEDANALYRLIAISGEPSLLPLLIEYISQDKTNGLYYCALHGSPQNSEILLKALADVRCAETADKAWFFFTAWSVARKPQLQLVGDNKKSSKETLPDVTDAKQWWSEQHFTEARYCLGLPVNPSNLIHIMQHYDGIWLNDIKIILQKSRVKSS